MDRKTSLHSSAGWALPAAVGDAVAGMLAGGIFFYVAGSLAGSYFIKPQHYQALRTWLGFSFEWNDMHLILAAISAVLGAIAGLISGALSRASHAKRNKQLSQVAKNLGYRYSPAAEPELRNRLARDFPVLDRGMASVMRVELRGIHLAVGEVTITRPRRDSDNTESEYTTEQTAAYFESDALRLPNFILQPEGLLLGWLADRAGVEDIDFAAHPEFSKAYLLQSTDAAAARKMFDDQLLRALGRRSGFHVASASGSLLIYRPGKICSPEGLKGFIGETTEIFRWFEEAARRKGFTSASAA
jgi:hypothetical protein